MLRKTLTIGFLAALFVFSLFSCAREEKVTEIGIISIIEHPALDATRNGFVDFLTESGFEEGENISYDYKNAKGKVENAHTIVAGFIGDKVDMILAIGTPVAKVAAEKTKDIPIMIAAITDPVGAELVDSIEKPGGNVTGTSDMNPVRAQFELIKEMLPNAKKVGILYNSGEPNSQALVEIARKVVKDMSLELVEATAMATSGVQAAVSSLVGKVDAVYMPTDNTMAAAVDVIIDVCAKNSISFFSSEDKSVKDGGAIASIGVDYYKLGRQTGSMAVKILRDGAKPATMPVEYQKEFNLFVNKLVAEKLGVPIPEDVIKRAKEVIE